MRLGAKPFVNFLSSPLMSTDQPERLVGLRRLFPKPRLFHRQAHGLATPRETRN